MHLIFSYRKLELEYFALQYILQHQHLPLCSTSLGFLSPRFLGLHSCYYLEKGLCVWNCRS